MWNMCGSFFWLKWNMWFLGLLFWVGESAFYFVEELVRIGRQQMFSLYWTATNVYARRPYIPSECFFSNHLYIRESLN